MTLRRTPGSQSFVADLDAAFAALPAAQATAVRISHHDQWAMPEASMAAFTFCICLTGGPDLRAA
jgi:hypothetical protein